MADHKPPHGETGADADWSAPGQSAADWSTADDEQLRADFRRLGLPPGRPGLSLDRAALRARLAAAEAGDETLESGHRARAEDSPAAAQRARHARTHAGTRHARTHAGTRHARTHAGTRRARTRSGLWWAGTAVAAALLIVVGYSAGLFGPPGNLIAPAGHGTRASNTAGGASGAAASEAAAVASEAGGNQAGATAQGPGPQVPLKAAAIPTPASFKSVDFIDAQHGWLVGNDAAGAVVLATSDGGQTWTRTSLKGDQAWSVSFADQHHGWLVAETGCLKSMCKHIAILGSADGGASWQTQWEAPFNAQNGVPINAMLRSRVQAFGDRAYAVVLGHLLATHDAGASWTTMVVPHGLPMKLDPLSISFLDAQQGWLAAQRCGASEAGAAGSFTSTACVPVVLGTSDGGQSWTTLFSPKDNVGSTLLTGSPAVAFSDAQHGWLFYKNGEMRGLLYRTTDGGLHWSLTDQDLVSARNVAGQPAFADAAHGWLPVDAGASPIPGGVWTTADGGASWTNATRNGRWSVHGVSLISATEGWAIAQTDLSLAGDFLAHTRDGGRTWQQVLPAPSPINGLSFADPQHAFGLGTAMDPGAVLRLNDDGTWSRVASFPGATGSGSGSGQNHAVHGPPIALAAAPGNTDRAWLVLEDQSGAPNGAVPVLATSDGGSDWTQVGTVKVDLSGMFAPLRLYMRAFDKQHLVLETGIEGGVAVAVSADGGATWRSVGRTPSLAAKSAQVAFATSDVGYAGVARGGDGARGGDDAPGVELYRTRDGGASWQHLKTLAGTLDVEALATDSGSDVWLLTHQPPGAAAAAGSSERMHAAITLWRSRDAGQSWSTVPFRAPAPVMQKLEQMVMPSGLSMQFSDAQHGWLDLPNGTLLETADGGASWTLAP